MKKLISMVLSLAMLTSAAAIPASAYSNENNTKYWDFESDNDIAFKWSTGPYSSKKPTNDDNELKPVVGAWQRAAESTYSSYKNDPTAVDHMRDYIPAVESASQYESLKELGGFENCGNRCARICTIGSGISSTLAMKMYLTDKDVVPGKVYKLSFYASANKNVPYIGFNDAGEQAVCVEPADYGKIRLYSAFKKISTKYAESGTTSKQPEWLKSGSWTNLNNNIYGANSTTLLKTGWNSYDMYITPQEEDFKNGLISLWLGVGTEYDSVAGEYPYMPEAFRFMYFDNVSLTPAETSETNNVVKYGMNWDFEDSESNEISTSRWSFDYGQWTIAPEHKGDTAYSKAAYMIPHYISTSDVKSRNEVDLKNDLGEGLQVDSPACSNQCVEMYMPAKADATMSTKLIGAKVKLSNKQIKAGEKYRLSFWAKGNSGVYTLYSSFTTADVPYALRAGYGMEDWLYNEEDEKKAGYLAKCWQRYTIELTATEADFNSKGDTLLWILGRHYGDTATATTNVNYGDCMYLDDITLEPVTKPNVTASETVYFHTDITNYSGTEGKNVIAAIYDGNQLSTCQSVTTAAGINVGYDFAVDIPIEITNPSIKLFIWDNATLKPLTDVDIIGQ